jgi:rhodanese-related sulfurtransferase
MLDLINNMFGLGAGTDFKELVNNGAQIIDVRSKEEFSGGHIKGSINIPLPILEQNLSRIKKDKPVITCCASGMRSASAKNLLAKKGYSNVHNGGGWSSLQSKI